MVSFIIKLIFVQEILIFHITFFRHFVRDIVEKMENGLDQDEPPLIPLNEDQQPIQMTCVQKPYFASTITEGNIESISENLHTLLKITIK